MKIKLRIFRGNKLLGIEDIPENSTSNDRVKVASKYKRYNRYFIDSRIIVKKGYDNRIVRGKNMKSFKSKKYIKILK